MIAAFFVETTTPAGADTRKDVVAFWGLPPGISVKTSQGQPTNCTRDEHYPSFKTTGGRQLERLYATVKDGGSCFFEASKNVWDVKLGDHASGQIWLGQDAAGQYYHAECYGTWKGARCVYPWYWTPPANQTLEILPLPCNSAVSVGQMCSEMQSAIAEPMQSVKANFTTNNKTTIRVENVGAVGCLDLNNRNPRFNYLKPGQSDTTYNGDWTYRFVGASGPYDTSGTRYGEPCIVTFSVKA
jgi:hypothetical protein